MNCRQVQGNLSFYLYGELDFAREEELERHLSGCAFCQQALSREKTWHTALQSENSDVPLDLLAQCRQGLRESVALETKSRPSARSWFRWVDSLHFSPTRWSSRIAMASFLVFVGFGLARWIDRHGLSKDLASGINQAGMFNPATARVRDIQPAAQGRIRVVFDQEGEMTGSVNDAIVRQLLLAATRDQDPGLRVSSMQMLANETGDDVLEALLNSVLHDPNAAIRMQALEGLRRYPVNTDTLSALRIVLQHDDNAGVRSEAIDVLAPLDRRLQMTPALVGTLQELMNSAQDDDYIRARCFTLLHEVNGGLPVY
jgi:hypothetical protein